MITQNSLTRRTVVVSLGSVLASGIAGSPLAALAAAKPDKAGGKPFNRSTVTEMARRLAQAPFAQPSQKLPESISALTYDQYRAIYFRPEAAVWADEKLPFQLQLFHRGFLFKDTIEIAIVEDGEAHHLAYSPDMYAPGGIVTQPLPKEDIGFAGLRIHGYINTPDRMDEVAVFQGASYFRSLGKGQIYGISARGLALNVGAAQGEEFPLFRAFWVEKPPAGSDLIVVHALLDSESVAGAYRFTIRPGLPTEMDVEATLFARTTLTSVGLGPGTSMFYFDGNGRTGFDDWRPQVHDFDGLLIVNGRGERLRRPLANPKTLQFSAFVDTSVRGFGLMQRTRAYEAFQDYNAHYERRPSLWVEPHGDWGKGSVVLIEILSDSEINDNIVAYWQPDEPITAKSEFSFAYRLSWGEGPPKPGVVIISTRRGRGDLGSASAVRRFVVDYADTGIAPPAGGPPAGGASALPTATVTANAGRINDVLVEVNPVTKGWRLSFNLDPQDQQLIELRAALVFADGRPVDTWLYRWTA